MSQSISLAQTNPGYRILTQTQLITNILTTTTAVPLRPVPDTTTGFLTTLAPAVPTSLTTVDPTSSQVQPQPQLINPSISTELESSPRPQPTQEPQIQPINNAAAATTVAGPVKQTDYTIKAQIHVEDSFASPQIKEAFEVGGSPVVIPAVAQGATNVIISTASDTAAATATSSVTVGNITEPLFNEMGQTPVGAIVGWVVAVILSVAVCGVVVLCCRERAIQREKKRTIIPGLFEIGSGGDGAGVGRVGSTRAVVGTSSLKRLRKTDSQRSLGGVDGTEVQVVGSGSSSRSSSTLGMDGPLLTEGFLVSDGDSVAKSLRRERDFREVIARHAVDRELYVPVRVEVDAGDVGGGGGGAGVLPPLGICGRVPHVAKRPPPPPPDISRLGFYNGDTYYPTMGCYPQTIQHYAILPMAVPETENDL
ncbi:hypothetical protein BDR26DRAFT_871978 [Obelidium mucronatum]|nr:hypothetical protein BDR26DRAFT_871978 [Obelidium mucronatum]